MPDNPSDNWPTEPRLLLDDPDPSRIRTTAIWHLSRALNSGRVVAFVGSGVPMAYGRMTWKELVLKLAREVMADAKEVMTDAKKVKDGANEKEAKSYERLIDRVKPLATESVETAQLPDLFLLIKLLDTKLAESALKEGDPKKRKYRSLDDRMRAAIFDDRGHAEQLLIKQLSWEEKKIQRGLDATTIGALNANLFGELSDQSKSTGKVEFTPSREWLDPKSRPESWRKHYAYRRAFTLGVVDQLGKIVGTLPSTPLADFVTSLLAVRSLKERALKELPAYHRFVIPSLVCLAPDMAKAAKLLLPPNPDDAPDFPPAATDASRIDTIPPERDPLLILHSQLGIERFLTTNYDLDLERLFRDLGYDHLPDPEPGHAAPASSRTDRLDALGARARDTVLTARDHGRLLDFATQDQLGRPQIVHLHGRATVGDRMVATERDYQRLYQRDDHNRRPMDVARHVAFGGNALLFVGLGMTEDDILRPLRQFMAQDARLGDRLAVALMPGLYRGAKREFERMSLLSRYGVYALHTGEATVNRDEEIALVRNWLSLALDMVDAVLKTIRCVDDGDASNGVEAKWQETEAELAWAKRPGGKDIDTADKQDIANFFADKSPNLRPVIALDPKPRPNLDGSVDIETQPSPDDPVKIEIDILNACIDIARNRTIPPPTPHQRHAIEIALEGVKSALITASLCAGLRRLECEWQAWKIDWRTLPIPRDANLRVDPYEKRNPPKPGNKWLPENGATVVNLQRHRRHFVMVPDKPDPNRKGHRFHAADGWLPSHGLEVFQDALRAPDSSRQPAIWTKIRGRRTFLLLDRPGVGKGHVFTALMTHTQDRKVPGLERFIPSSWGREIKDKPTESHPYYVAAFGINLGFSHEVASVFDHIASFLWHYWPDVFAALPKDHALEKEHERIGKELLNDRHGRILALLGLYHRAAEEQAVKEAPRPRRLLLAITNISALFDANGEPKNAGLGRIFNWFIGDMARLLPLDLVLLCSTESIPAAFRPAARRTTPPSVTPTADEDPKPSSPMVLVYGPDTGFTHRRTIREELLTHGMWPIEDQKDSPDQRHFPASGHVLKEGKVKNPDDKEKNRDDKEKNPDDIVVVHLLRRAPVSLLAGAFFPRVAAEIALASEEWSKQNHSTDNFIDISRIVSGSMKGDIKNSYNKIRKLSEIEAAIIEKLGEKLSIDIEKTATSAAARFRALDGAVGKRRIGATILFAAADELIGPVKDDMEAHAGIPARQFLADAQVQLHGLNRTQKAVKILDIALAAMERRHRERRPPPIDLNAIEKLGPASHQLLRTLLWHIAIVGDPIDADVLAACPEVREAVEAVKQASAEREEKSPTGDFTTAVIEDALQLLLHRCLIMEVSPANAQDKPPRYGMTRVIQRYIIRLLDAPLGNLRTLDRYSLSLYFSQPGDLPRPSIEAHHRLRNLIIGLTGYKERFDTNDPCEQKRHEKLRIFAARLRAAYGVLASVYHVAILSRFDVYGSDDTARYPGLGHFESHRQLVLWVLHEAKRISRPIAAAQEKKAPIPQPFYAGEIVWLYNEAGLLSLAQGRIVDASVLFRLALDVARKYVAPNDAALFARITLNAAVAGIERGGAGRARERLNRVLAMKDESPVIKAIAKGLIGWTEHLEGDLDAAKLKYDDAIKTLQSSERGRPAAFFILRLGDLERARGHFNIADQHFDTAEHLARQGAHEDLVQFVRLSRVRLLIERNDPEELRQAQRTLDSIELYGRNVGLPRIQTEVASVRAELVLRQGEHRQASDLAKEALTIANLHDIRTYKARALAVLGRALRAEGASETADLLHRRAHELARRSGYTILAKRIEDSLQGTDGRKMLAD